MIEVIRQAQWDRRSQYKTILPDFLWILKLNSEKNNLKFEKIKLKLKTTRLISTKHWILTKPMNNQKSSN